VSVHVPRLVAALLRSLDARAYPSEARAKQAGPTSKYRKCKHLLPEFEKKTYVEMCGCTPVGVIESCDRRLVVAKTTQKKKEKEEAHRLFVAFGEVQLYSTGRLNYIPARRRIATRQ